MDLTNIILELQDRVIRLEKEVTLLKESMKERDKIQDDAVATPLHDTEKNDIVPYNIQSIARTRDKTRYLFQDAVYLKNHLVFAVVQDYVKTHRSLVKEELQEVFPKHLQGSIGVVVDIEKAKMRNDYNVRFFTDENEILHLVDGDMVVCSQWGILNIPNFLERANQLGYIITEIK